MGYIVTIGGKDYESALSGEIIRKRKCEEIQGELRMKIKKDSGEELKKKKKTWKRGKEVKRKKRKRKNKMDDKIGKEI